MANDLQTKGNQLPDYLKDMQKHEKIGNLDESDRIVPRVQLLQALSPELTEFNEAKPGQFWHNIATQLLGPTLRAVPIIVRKSIVLWGPRSEESKIPLARSMDCIHWDTPGLEFTVKPKGSPQPVTYKLRGSVKESGLAEFGSSIPGDPNSPPAASLTYNTLWFLVDYPELSPVVVINARSSIKPTQQLYNRIDMRPVAHYAQQWELGIKQEKGAEGPYFNYTYKADGYPEREIAEYCKALYEKYRDIDWRATDESESSDNGGGGFAGGNGAAPEAGDKY